MKKNRFLREFLRVLKTDLAVKLKKTSTFKIRRKKMKKLIYILITILTTFTLVSCIKPPQNLNPHGEIYVDKEWDMFESGHLVNEPITRSEERRVGKECRYRWSV